MNQNPPPRGPDNPYYGAEDRNTSESGPLNQNTMQNQQSHYPFPPTEGTPVHGYGSGGPPHGGPIYGPGLGGGYPTGYPTPPGHFHYPPYPPGYGSNPYDTTVMSTKDWLLTLLIFMLPCVNIIMLFVWAFSGSGNHNRRNYSRATLILVAIITGLYIMAVLFFGFGAVILSLLTGI